MMLLFVLFFLSLLLIADTFRLGISPMPSSRKAREKILELAGGKRMYELGSGWGHLAFPLAAQYPEAKITACEKALVPYYASKFWQLIFSSPNLEIVRRDLFSLALYDADLVVCYLYPAAMSRIKEKFEKELSPGTMVISNCFRIPGWKEELVFEATDLMRSRIYLYYYGYST